MLRLEGNPLSQARWASDSRIRSQDDGELAKHLPECRHYKNTSCFGTLAHPSAQVHHRL